MLSDVQFEEFRKCSQDPIYFFENFVHIRTVNGDKLFKPFPWQKRLTDAVWHKGKHVLVLKSRQVGLSWWAMAFFAWVIIFTFDSLDIILMSADGDKARKLMDKLRYILYRLPYWMIDTAHKGRDNPEIYILHDTRAIPSVLTVIHAKYDNVEEKYIPVATSSVYSLTTTGKSGAGDTANYIFLDEAALPGEKSYEVWTALRPAAALGGKMIVGSTPRGFKNKFAELITLAETDNLPGWEYVRVHYTDSGITREQMLEMTSGMTAEERAQEYELQFLAAQRPVFNLRDLAYCYRPINLPGIDFDGLMLKYEEILALAGLPHSREDCEREYNKVIDLIQRSTRFYSGVDTSGGKDLNSVCTFNEFGVQVDAAHNHLPLSKWAGYDIVYHEGNIRKVDIVPGFVSEWHAKYPGIMVIETNGPGEVVFQRHITPPDGISQVIGKRMTDNIHRTGTKSIIVYRMIQAIEGHQIIITDHITYKALQAYSYLNERGATGAPPGQYDDPAISAMWAWYALTQHGIDYADWPRDAAAMANLKATERRNANQYPARTLLNDLAQITDNRFIEGIRKWDEIDLRRIYSPL